jgi:hypothetical protein
MDTAGHAAYEYSIPHWADLARDATALEKSLAEVPVLISPLPYGQLVRRRSLICSIKLCFHHCLYNPP